MFSLKINVMLALLAGTLHFGDEVNSPSQVQVATPPHPHVNLNALVVREQMSADSGEFLRTHLLDGRLVISYRRNPMDNPLAIDGGTGTVTLLADGNWDIQELRNDAGTVVGHLEYADDANHTIISGWRHYDDGSKYLEFSQGSHGETILKQYWRGNRLYMRQVVNVDGSYLLEFHSRDSGRWVKRRGPKLLVTSWQEESDADGHLQLRMELVDDKFVQTFFRPDGTTYYKRLFLARSPFTGALIADVAFVDVYQSLLSVEEFGTDGVSVTRKLALSLEPHPVRKTWSEGEGMTMITWAHPNGQVYRREGRDADGKPGNIFINGQPWPYLVETAQPSGGSLLQELDQTGKILTEQTRDASGALSKKTKPVQAGTYAFDRSITRIGLEYDEAPLKPQEWWFYDRSR
jgi:hypothetical protein